ncbi:MAG: Hint domain-containing protein [Pseudomonadota bacterium]
MALEPGDLLFVGWDADNEDISFVTTRNITEGEVIYFTDDEWNGTQFNTNEQLIEWIVPAGGIPLGTVVTIDMVPAGGNSSASIDVGGDVDYIRGGGQLAVSNEMFWAFQGDRVGNTVTPTNFIGVIANEAQGNNNQSPNLSGTGLTPTNGAIIIDGDEDYMEFVLDDPEVYNNRDELIAAVSDLSNWDTADGTGNNNPNGTGFDLAFDNFFCFTPGTRIRAPGGPRLIETLSPGDLVCTRDHGPQEIRYIARRRLGAMDLARSPTLRPIIIEAGAMGDGLPKRRLTVSRQHRMVVSGWRMALMFDEYEMLAPAISLVNDHSVRIDHRCQEVEYIHLLFDRHEIIFAEGAATESFHPGETAKNAFDAATRTEVLQIFPWLERESYGPVALPTLRPFEGQAVARAL